MPENGNTEKIAIMGGTFDPIHFGHLASAETVRHEFGFDKIVFIPSGTPPHKALYKVTDGELRYLMTSFAISSNEYFDISKIEINRKGNTYTIDTVKEIKKIYPHMSSVNFITGADALFDIPTWHDAENLLRLCSIIAITRPGYNETNLLKQIDYLRNNSSADITYLEVPALSISSTDIRHRVKTGQPIKYLVPDSVEDFIFDRRLYK